MDMGRGQVEVTGSESDLIRKDRPLMSTLAQVLHGSEAVEGISAQVAEVGVGAGIGDEGEKK